LLLISLRLGLKSFNADYIQAVAHTFSLPQSVGVLGGRPRGARWFYGALSDGSKIFGLDPHTVQNAPRRRTARVNGEVSSVVDMSEDYLRSVHTTYPENFTLLQMDPSIALGFYCRTEEELENVFSSMQQWKQQHPESPELFTVGMLHRITRPIFRRP
jgi:cysteine protease ATG4